MDIRGVAKVTRKTKNPASLSDSALSKTSPADVEKKKKEKWDRD